jgi:hypothetical protein
VLQNQWNVTLQLIELCQVKWVANPSQAAMKPDRSHWCRWNLRRNKVSWTSTKQARDSRGRVRASNKSIWMRQPIVNWAQCLYFWKIISREVKLPIRFIKIQIDNTSIIMGKLDDLLEIKGLTFTACTPANSWATEGQRGYMIQWTALTVDLILFHLKRLSNLGNTIWTTGEIQKIR